MALTLSSVVVVVTPLLLVTPYLAVTLTLTLTLALITGTVLSIAPSLPSELLPLSHQRLAQAGVLSPAGVGFFFGPLIAAALRSVTGDYASAAVTAASCLGAGSIVMAYLAMLPSPAHAAAPPNRDSMELKPI